MVVCWSVLHSLCRLFPQLTPWMPTARKITEAKCLWKEVCYQPTSKQTIKNSSPQTISYERRYKSCSSPPPPSTKLIIIFCAKPWSSSPMCCSSHKPLLYHLNLEKKKTAFFRQTFSEKINSLSEVIQNTRYLKWSVVNILSLTSFWCWLVLCQLGTS